MTMPFYVAPEQMMRDKAQFARTNIARGRPLIATFYDDGILLAAETHSRTLRKISEIYDRIAFGGVGKYSEYDQLRTAGVRHADLKGYQYSREDVDARSLAKAYGQTIGQVFTHELKPLEVEILVAEVGETEGADEIYHVTYEGVPVDEEPFSVLGGEAETIVARMQDIYESGWGLGDALKGAVTALAGPDRSLTAEDLEVAVLARSRLPRAFRRVLDPEIASLLEAKA